MNRGHRISLQGLFHDHDRLGRALWAIETPAWSISGIESRVTWTMASTWD
jgi:hypothetical protein